MLKMKAYRWSVVAVLLLIAPACEGTTSAAQATAPQSSVDYRGVSFQVPSSLALSRVNVADVRCPEAKLVSPAARVHKVRMALDGAAITLFPYQASGKCVDMRHVYQGGWRHASSKYGLAMLIGPNPYVTKSKQGLAVWEYAAIPSRNLGLQLFGFGGSAASALSQDRAILATARAG